MSSRETAQLARVLAERAAFHAQQGMESGDRDMYDERGRDCESNEHGDTKCSWTTDERWRRRCAASATGWTPLTRSRPSSRTAAV